MSPPATPISSPTGEHARLVYQPLFEKMIPRSSPEGTKTGLERAAEIEPKNMLAVTFSSDYFQMSRHTSKTIYIPLLLWLVALATLDRNSNPVSAEMDPCPATCQADVLTPCIQECGNATDVVECQQKCQKKFNKCVDDCHAKINKKKDSREKDDCHAEFNKETDKVESKKN